MKGERIFIFLGMPNPSLLLQMDKLVGGFGRGRWALEVWEPKLRWKTRRALNKLAREGAHVTVKPWKADDTYDGWLRMAAKDYAKVLLAVNVGGAEREILPPCDLTTVHQLYLATHGHRDPHHDWLAEERFLDSIRRQTKLQFLL